MNGDAIAVSFLVIFGIVAGYFVARNANQHEEIQGGALAQASNYLASAILVAMAPTVLCAVLVIHPTFVLNSTILSAIFIALVMVSIALIMLLPYALAEKPHIERRNIQEDKGWTREDAETSGL
jgi:glucan phosphoethanolaminetransferase (alkaline phosphatase superfamily)